MTPADARRAYLPAMSGLPAGKTFECTGRAGTPAKELVLRWLDSSVSSTHCYFVKLGGEQGLLAKIARYRTLESDEPIEIGNKMLIALLRGRVKEEPRRFAADKDKQPGFKIAAKASYLVPTTLPINKMLVDRRTQASLEKDAAEWRALRKGLKKIANEKHQFSLLGKMHFAEALAIQPSLSCRQFPRLTSVIVRGALEELGLRSLVTDEAIASVTPSRVGRWIPELGDMMDFLLSQQLEEAVGAYMLLEIEPAAARRRSRSRSRSVAAASCCRRRRRRSARRRRRRFARRRRHRSAAAASC